MRLLHLKCAIAEKNGDKMRVRLYFRSFDFSMPDKTLEVDFSEKLIASTGGYGFSFFTGQLVITDDETDVEMPPFGPPTLVGFVHPESRVVFGDDTHAGWVTGPGRKRPSEAAGFDMKTIQKMFPG